MSLCNANGSLRRASRVIAFFGNGIGDGVLALPTLRALKYWYGSRIHFVVNQRFVASELGFANCSVIEMPMNIRKDGREFDHTILRERMQDCDLFMCLAQWSSNSLERLLDGSPATTVGFCRGFDLEIASPDGVHQFDLMFSLARTICKNFHVEMFSSPLEPPANVRGAAQDIIDQIQSERVIGFHPEGSYPEKSCSAKLTEQMVRALAERHPRATVCVFGIAPDLKRLESIAENVVVLNTVPFDLGAHLISYMDLFIGVDSSFLHAADLARVPGIGLFGPTDCSNWGYRFSKHTHFTSNQDEEVANVFEVVNAVDAHLSKN